MLVSSQKLLLSVIAKIAETLIILMVLQVILTISHAFSLKPGPLKPKHQNDWQTETVSDWLKKEQATLLCTITFAAPLNQDYLLVFSSLSRLSLIHDHMHVINGKSGDVFSSNASLYELGCGSVWLTVWIVCTLFPTHLSDSDGPTLCQPELPFIMTAGISSEHRR